MLKFSRESIGFEVFVKQGAPNCFKTVYGPIQKPAISMCYKKIKIIHQVRLTL